jgi:hypothetical protein
LHVGFIQKVLIFLSFSLNMVYLQTNKNDPKLRSLMNTVCKKPSVCMYVCIYIYIYIYRERERERETEREK